MPISETNILPVTSNSTTSYTIPPEATVNPQIQEEADLPVRFSFKDYNQNACEIHKFSRDKEVRQVTEKLKIASRTNIGEFKKTLTPVTNAGAYTILFNGLEKDAELWEIVCAGTKRVFGYLALGIFNVIAITSTHIEVGKNRR